MADRDKGIEILVVDRYPEMQGVVSTYLKGMGYDPAKLTRSDGSNAASLVAEKKFGLITTGTNMTAIGGEDFIKATRASEKNGTTPIVAISSDTTPAATTSLTKAGATAVLVKPFKSENLEAALARVFDKPAEEATGTRPTGSTTRKQMRLDMLEA